MSATIKPVLFASHTKTSHAIIKPVLFASGVFADLPPPPEFGQVIITPMGVTISRKSFAAINITPAGIAAVKSNGANITISGITIAVSFYTHPGSSFISKYKPMIAVSFIAKDRRLYFRSSYQDNLPFFPTSLNKFIWKSSKTLAWETQKAAATSGKIRTLSGQVLPKITFDTKLAHVTDNEVEILFDFIRLVNGSRNNFLWLDEDENVVNDAILHRDAFGYYRLPFSPLNTYIEYAWHISNIKVTLEGAELPPERFLFLQGAIIILDENGYEIKTDLGEIRASFTYYWKVHFVDDGQGIERIFYNFNRSKTFKMEVVR